MWNITNSLFDLQNFIYTLNEGTFIIPTSNMALVRETNIHGWNNEGQEFHLHSLKHCPKLIRMMKNKHWTARFFEMWYIAETQKWDSYVTTSFNNSIENHNGRQYWWGNIIEDFEVVDKNPDLGLLAWSADHENWIRVLGMIHFFIFYFTF